MKFTLTAECQQFFGKPFGPILHVKAQRVDLSASRGIIFDKPERFAVNTPVGQIDIGAGDWVVTMPSGAVYVIKDDDMPFIMSKSNVPYKRRRKWWPW